MSTRLAPVAASTLSTNAPSCAAELFDVPGPVDADRAAASERAVVEREHAVAVVGQQGRQRLPVVGHVLERPVHEDHGSRMRGGRLAREVVGARRARGRAGMREPVRAVVDDRQRTRPPPVPSRHIRPARPRFRRSDYAFETTLARSCRDRRSRSAALADLYPFAESIKRPARAALRRRCGRSLALDPLRAARDLRAVAAVGVVPGDLGDLGEQVIGQPDRSRPSSTNGWSHQAVLRGLAYGGC